MSWNDPNDFVAGSKLFASQLNVLTANQRYNRQKASAIWSLPSGTSYSTTSANFVPVDSGENLTINTDGFPVLVYWLFNISGATNSDGLFRFVRDSTNIISTAPLSRNGASSLGFDYAGVYIDTPPAGSHTYEVQWLANGTIEINSFPYDTAGEVIAREGISYFGVREI